MYDSISVDPIGQFGYYTFLANQSFITRGMLLMKHMRIFLTSVLLCLTTQVSEANQRLGDGGQFAERSETNTRSVGLSLAPLVLPPIRVTPNRFRSPYRWEYQRPFSYQPHWNRYRLPFGSPNNGGAKSVEKKENEEAAKVLKKVVVYGKQSEVTDYYLKMLIRGNMDDVGRYLNDSLKLFNCSQLAESYVKAKTVYDELSKINWPANVDPIELNKLIYQGAKIILFGSEDFEKVDSYNYQEGGFLVYIDRDGNLRLGRFERGGVGKEFGSQINLYVEPREGEKVIAYFHSHPIYKFPFSKAMSEQYNTEVNRPFPSNKDMLTVTQQINSNVFDKDFVQFIGKLYIAKEGYDLRVVSTQYLDYNTASSILNLYYQLDDNFVVWNSKVTDETIEVNETGYPVVENKDNKLLNQIENSKCAGIRKGYGRR